MSNYSKIYWLTRLDSLQDLFTTVFTICAIIIILYIVYMCISCDDSDDRKEYNEKYSKYLKVSFIIGLFTLIISTFLPNKNDMIMIYTGGKTMDYVQSDTSLQKLPQQTTLIISKYLDKQIEELNKK